MRSTTLVVITLIAGIFAAAPGVAHAAHNSSHPAVDDLSALVTEVAEANQRLSDLNASIQQRQEAVNKAIVDVQNARDAAATAKRDVDASGQALTDADAAIAASQRRFDSFAAATYVNGPSGSYLTAVGPEDIITSAAAGEATSAAFQQVLTDLQRARTEFANRESRARAAQATVDETALAAQRSQDAAVTALTEAQRGFGAQQAEIERLAARRDAAQARLNALRPTQPPAAVPPDRWEPGAAAAGSPPANSGQWDTTLPMVPGANVADPVAIVNSV